MSITNPLTGRRIKEGGKTHRSLQMGGVLTEEERAFIARNNKKAQFKRAIQALPRNEQPGYEANLEDPNFAQHLRDAQSDVEIHRKRRQMGAGLFGSQKFMIDDNMSRKLSDLVDKAFAGFSFSLDDVIKTLPEGSKLRKEGQKLMQTNSDYLNKILKHAEARMLQ